MTRSRFARVQSHFLDAVTLQGEDLRVYMQHLQAEDPSVAADVNALLDNQDGADDFFSEDRVESSMRSLLDEVYDAWATPETLPTTPSGNISLDTGPTSIFDSEDAMPQRIGPYPVLKKLGAGGMGEVYLVQETEPVKKKVALKVLNRAHTSKEALARFRAEAQALALMQHHNIAQLFHFEAKDPRLAFFTMEYIVGEPIHIYCEEHELSVEARLELFLQVCDGVFHAHQKGIIHRDLKPNNIMIATQDGHPVAKVIDFGIAKAIEGEGRDAIATMMTANNALVGTPAYMPPEQVAEQAGKSHVDTRSDIYALGAILYQLLTDQTLIDPFIFRQMNWGQRIDTLRNPRVVKPSQCLSALDELKQIAEKRGVSSKGLVHKLSGDLDLVIMKCLAIEPDERYASVDQLRGDLRAWLEGRTVSVMPPSTLYRVKKYVQRNRGPVVAGLLILLSLVTGLSAALVSRQNALEARELAVEAQGETESALNKADAVQRFLQSIIASPDPFELGPEVKLVDVLKDAESKIEADLVGQPEVEARIRYSLSQSYRSIGLLVEAQEQAGLAYEILKSLELDHSDYGLNVGILLSELMSLNWDPMTEGFLSDLAERVSKVKGPRSDYYLRVLDNLCFYYDEMEQQEKALKFSIQAYELALDIGKDSVAYETQMASLYLDNGRVIEAEKIYQNAIDSYKRRGLKKSYGYVSFLIGMSSCLLEMKKFEEAKVYIDEALDLSKVWFGDNDYRTLFVNHNLARYYCLTDRVNPCLSYSESSYRKRKTVYGENHPLTLESQRLFVTANLKANDSKSSVQDLEAYVQKMIDLGLENRSDYLAMINNLAYFYCRQGRCSDAVDILMDTLGESPERFNKERLVLSYLNLGEAHYFLGDFEKSINMYAIALHYVKETEFGEPFYYKYTLAKVGEVLLEVGRIEEARKKIEEGYDYHGQRKNTSVHKEVVAAYQKLQVAIGSQGKEG